eukprot:contig_13693_g3293
MFAKRATTVMLQGMTGAFVDDLFYGGDESFQELTKMTLARFQAKERKWDNGAFVGVWLATAGKPTTHFTAGQS